MSCETPWANFRVFQSRVLSRIFFTLWICAIVFASLEETQRARVMYNRDSFEYTKETEHIDGDFCEKRRQFVDGIALDAVEISPPSSKSTPKEPTVLCALVTYEPRHHAVSMAAKTYGHRCTGFVALSDVEDPRIPTIRLDYNGPHTYEMQWVKRVACLRHLRRYLDSGAYDYVFLLDDDTYIIYDNLISLLKSDVFKSYREADVGIYAGAVWRMDFNNKNALYERFYNVGGAVLSDVPTLERALWAVDNDVCANNVHGWTNGTQRHYEDLYLKLCLDGAADVGQKVTLPFDTRDADGRHRFFPVTLEEHMQGNNDSPVISIGDDGNTDSTTPPSVQTLYYIYSGYTMGFVPGLAGVSPNLISIHRVKNVTLMAELHAFMTMCK